MSVYPSAIIMVNDDLTDSTESTLIRQLMIDEVMDGYAFDDVLASNPNFVTDQKLLGKRIMVVKNLYQVDITTVDVVIYLKYGMVTVERNMVATNPWCSNGSARATFPLINLNWKELGFTGGNHSIM